MRHRSPRAGLVAEPRPGSRSVSTAHAPRPGPQPLRAMPASASARTTGAAGTTPASIPASTRRPADLTIPRASGPMLHDIVRPLQEADSPKLLRSASHNPQGRARQDRDLLSGSRANWQPAGSPWRPSRPQPGATEHDVEDRLIRAECHVDAQVQARVSGAGLPAPVRTYILCVSIQWSQHSENRKDLPAWQQPGCSAP